MRKTLLILAAGMGSRYGGLKQIDAVGPNGEFLIDYSVFDAIKAGFEKIVFVIREEFATEFKRHFEKKKIKSKIELVYVYQKIDDLPAGFELKINREKPWGTGQAILAARAEINEPFAVISADDFYGREAFDLMALELDKLGEQSQNQYLLIGYRLGKTLSENGWVARGLCKVDEDHNLTSIHEHTRISRLNGKIVSRDKNEQDHELEPDRLVSMVMFGFTKEFLTYLENDFKEFLSKNINEEKMEFFTPNVVNNLIQMKKAKMKVVPTKAQWFGVTYKEDKKITVEQIKKLIEAGVYPSNLDE